MKKINEKEVERIIEKAKEDYGGKLHYVLFIYEGKKTGQLKWTQHMETGRIEMIIGILERIKSLFVSTANNPNQIVSMSAKKKKKVKKKKKK